MRSWEMTTFFTDNQNLWRKSRFHELGIRWMPRFFFLICTLHRPPGLKSQILKGAHFIKAILKRQLRAPRPLHVKIIAKQEAKFLGHKCHLVGAPRQWPRWPLPNLQRCERPHAKKHHEIRVKCQKWAENKQNFKLFKFWHKKICKKE